MASSTDRGALPTFIVIGAQKCATRWLRINLGQHPQIFTAPSELGALFEAAPFMLSEVVVLLETAIVALFRRRSFHRWT